MAHFGTLRDFRFHDDIDDIRGADLYGRNDEKLGEIDDVIFDHSTGQIQFAVVDAGGWLSSKRFIVPADRIYERAGHEDDFAVDLTKDQIQRFPEYQDDKVSREQDWDEYQTRYHASWDESPVLHKEGSVNIITPEPDEMPISGSSTTSTGSMGDVTPTRLAGKFPDTAPDPSKTRLRPAGAASDAEDTSLPGRARESRSPVGMGDDIVSEHDRTAGRDRLGRGSSEADLTGVAPDTRRFDGEVSGRAPGEELEGSGYGDVDRTVVRTNTRDLPPSYRDTADGSLDPSNDLHRPYPVQQGRHRRWAAFEDHLRRNRVDVTSSCRACDTAKDKVA